MTLVCTRLGIEDDDAPVAVAIGHEDLVSRRVDGQAGSAIDVFRVVAAAALAMPSDL